MNGNWSQTAPAGNVGEYFDNGSAAAPGSMPSAAGVPYQVPNSYRLGALESVAQNVSQPLPRMLGSGALLVGGLLMAAAEFGKDHHGTVGRYGRIAVGAGAAYWGFMFFTEALEQFRAAKGV